MKKLSLLFFITVLCYSITFAQNGRIELQTRGSKQECTKESFTGFSATFSFSNIESMQVSTEKGVFSAITIPNTYPSGDEGTPSLPIARQLISVPFDANPTVTVKSYTTTEYSLSEFGISTLMPQQPSVRKDIKPEDVKFVYNASSYQMNRYNERSIAEVEVLGTMRGIQIGALTINPICYNPSNNTIRVYNDIEIEVSFEGGNYTKTQHIYQSTFSPYFAPVYKTMFNRDVYDDHPDLWNTPVRMLVIANRMFETTLAPWLEWKTQKGFYLDVNYTDVIGTSYNAIKTFIENKYNEGVSSGTVPTFVAIIGDVAQVANTIGNSSGKVTDLYYSSVDGDYFPDIYSFRMSAENTAQLEAIINKVLMYEKYTMPDPSYLNNALLIAGQDNYWNPLIAQPTINYATTNYYNTEHGFTNIYSYLNSYSGCYNNLNTGVGFVNYTAHGGDTEWSGPSFTTSNVNSLTNNEKYFWAIGNCCLAANFGYSQPCLAEAFIRAENKGAFAYIGSCPSSYWYEDYYFSLGANNSLSGTPPTPATSSTGFYDAVFTDDMYNTINSALFVGNLSVTHSHSGGYSTHSSPLYYWQSYHVLGDGSVMPYITEPTENTVSHMAIIPIGMSTYTVSADPGSYVAISKDGVLHGAAMVDATGSVDVVIEPILSGGDVMIVVTCPQRQPVIETVPAAALEGPYIVVGGYTPQNLGIGETKNISVTMSNVGNDPTTSVTTVTFTCSDPLITISNGTASYSAIASGNEVTVNNAFTITADPTITNGSVFTVIATAVNGSETWTSNIAITVFSPILVYENFTWAGSFEPGQSYDLVVDFKNSGGFNATNVIGTITSSNSNVTINNVTYNYGTMAPNGIVSGIFNVTISSTAPTNEPITFDVDLAGDYNITASTSITLANSCNVVFELNDSYGDGWNGAKLRVTFDDGTPQVEYTISSGSTASFTKEINTGTTVTLTWVSGSWDSECSFTVSYEDGDQIYASSGTPAAGILTTFVCQCGGSASICDPITNLTVSVSGTTVILNWSGNADSYIVKRNGVEIGTPTTVGFTDVNVENGSYNYCVYAVCPTSVSTPVCETVEIGSNCNPPTNLTATLNGNNVVELTWTASTTAVSYNIYLDDSFLINTSSTTYSYQSEGIMCTQCYYVTSVCVGEIESDPSNEACFTVLGIVNITASASSNGTIYPEGNVVVNCGENQMFTFTPDVNYSILSVIVDGVNIGVVSSYTFENVTNNHTISVDFTPVNITEIESSLKIYPNPAKETLFVELDSDIQELNIYNALGQVVYNANNCGNNTNISVSNFTTGIYMIKILSNNQSIIKKFIIE